MTCLDRGGEGSLSASNYLCQEQIIQCNTCIDFLNYTARFILLEDSLRMFFLQQFCDLLNKFPCNCDTYAYHYVLISIVKSKDFT